jgi:hypothetical protein
MSKDSLPPPGVDLRIIQLYGEGVIGTTWPRIHPRSHLSLAEWLDVMANKGSQEIQAHQPTP